MNKDIHFGEENSCVQVRVYDGSDETIGYIKKNSDKPKYIWNPLFKYKAKYPFAILEADIETSKQIVHKLLSGL